MFCFVLFSSWWSLYHRGISKRLFYEPWLREVKLHTLLYSYTFWLQMTSVLQTMSTDSENYKPWKCSRCHVIQPPQPQGSWIITCRGAGTLAGYQDFRWHEGHEQNSPAHVWDTAEGLLGTWMVFFPWLETRLLTGPSFTQLNTLLFLVLVQTNKPGKDSDWSYMGQIFPYPRTQ